MKYVLFALVLTFGLGSCAPTKKVACDQVPMMSDFASKQLADVLECERADLIKAEMAKQLDEVLGCNKDAAMGAEICKVVVEQAIMLIPDENYGKYECKLKDVASKVKPLADMACDLIKSSE